MVRQEQRDILEEYRDDFGKHLDENEEEETDFTLLGRINRVFESIPAQLAKENKKFVFSMLEKKGRAEKYLTAIQWLADFGLVSFCHNLSNITDPLEGNKIDNVFKIYMQDSGLEIDLVTKIAGELALIEVKATTGNTKSADTVLKNPQYEVETCYKLSENNIGVKGNKITVPYYMASFLGG